MHHLLGHPSDLPGHIETHGPLAVAVGRHTSWEEALTASLESSGLVGRGGGGFPSAAKLALASSQGDGGTLVVNGMEGEPASDKDKVLLTRAPHLVLDGAQFLAAMCRAHRIVVCIPAGRDGVTAAVQHAISERSAARYSRVARRDRSSTRSLRRRRGVVAALDRFGAPAPGVPTRQGNSVAHRETTGSGAQRRDTGARRTHRPERSGAVLGPWHGRRARDVSRYRWGCRRPARRRRDRPRDGPAGHRQTRRSGRATTSPPRRGLRRVLGRTARVRDPYASIPLRAIGACAGVGVVVAIGEEACGVAETARIAHYLAVQSSGQRGPCVFGLPAIADDLARLARGQSDPGLMPRLQRRLSEVNGRGACRHPDGAVSLVRSALSVFDHDVTAHAGGEPCAHWREPSSLPFPRPTAAWT